MSAFYEAQQPVITPFSPDVLDGVYRQAENCEEYSGSLRADYLPPCEINPQLTSKVAALTSLIGRFAGEGALARQEPAEFALPFPGFTSVPETVVVNRPPKTIDAVRKYGGNA